MEKLTRMRELTLFAPSNAAWRDPSLNLIMRDRKKIRDILHIHLVEEKLPMEKILYNNINQVGKYYCDLIFALHIATVILYFITEIKQSDLVFKATKVILKFSFISH